MSACPFACEYYNLKKERDKQVKFGTRFHHNTADLHNMFRISIQVHNNRIT